MLSDTEKIIIFVCCVVAGILIAALAVLAYKHTLPQPTKETP
jgi:hypothetical protein